MIVGLPCLENDLKQGCVKIFKLVMQLKITLFNLLHYFEQWTFWSSSVIF
jgi:hypothetical protein